MWYYSGLVRSEKISFSPAGCGGIVVGGICPAAFGLWGWDGRLSDRIMDFVCDPLFFIAKDKESITDFVVSELFVDICKRNGLLIDFKEV